VATKPAAGATLAIDEFLAEEGFTDPAAVARGRAVLERTKLTNPRKQSMELRKRAEAETALRQAQIRTCGHEECLALRTAEPLPPEELVHTAPERCDICGGSNNRRAALRLEQCFRAHGLRRLLIVGGSDDVRADANRLLNGAIDLRHVDGTKGGHTLKTAKADLKWADVMVICGSSELPHKVSNLYTRPDPPEGLVTIPLTRRGLEALCQEVTTRLGPAT
jgi:hypothetical protein